MPTFIDDYSTSHPGKMGWGTELFNDTQRMVHEKMAQTTLESVCGELLIRQDAKPVVNTTLNDQVNILMGNDGIEDGFSFLHLEKAVYGDVIDWVAQIIGSCVASGGFYADVARLTVECFLLQDPEQLFGNTFIGPNSLAPFAPWNYRWGRHYGNLNGNMDGSFCAEHIRGKLEKGYLLCSDIAEGYPDNWLPEPQDASTYRRWGANNQLVDKYASLARFKLLESESVHTGNDLMDLVVVHKKPMQICSNYGFAPTERINGFEWEGQPVYLYRRKGNWAHNMTIYGCVKVNGNWYVIVRNSWGKNAHRNGCFFVVSMEDANRWLRDAECMTIGNIDAADNPNPFPEL